MTEDAILRSFRAEDLEAVKRLVDHSIEVTHAGAYAREAADFLRGVHTRERILSDASDGCTLILKRHGTIVGTGTLSGAKIRRLFIDPSLQRRGLGSRLMRELEARAEAAGTTPLVLSAVPGSEPFYQALGYAIAQEKSIPLPDGSKFVLHAMSKELVACAEQRHEPEE